MTKNRIVTTRPLLFIAFVLASCWSFAQEDTGWHLQDPSTDGVNGASVEKTYTKAKDRQTSTVVVAILDSGVDIEHEDLRDKIWVNRDEIPGNGIDDDENGYVDDVHGWNFLGNKDGENVVQETLEITRLYAKYRDYFDGKDVAKLNKKDRKLYNTYLEYKETVQAEKSKAKLALSNMDQNEQMLLDAFEAFDKEYPDLELTEEFIESFDPGEDPQLNVVQQVFKQIMQFGLDVTSTAAIREEIKTGYAEAKNDFKNKVDYWYNPDFDSREIIGDDYDDVSDRDYGNPDVIGAHNFHGTHVAGIVGATRDNDTGVKGIATDVELMVIRVVPDGDEHDKDVANAIRYAAENGASVINMSFGKGQKYDKRAVDKAVKYAMKKDVLLVHAAGNSAENNDTIMHYPVPQFEKSGLFGKKEAPNWIEVGALTNNMNEGAIASFSNYGAETVDLFAPGQQIVSTAPGDAYQPASGTSMASPVVAGVAALIRSYYPSLTAEQVKEVLVQSTVPVDYEVAKPGSSDLVSMKELSRTGGIISASRAFELAAKTKGKKKVKEEKKEKSSSASA